MIHRCVYVEEGRVARTAIVVSGMVPPRIEVDLPRRMHALVVRGPGGPALPSGLFGSVDADTVYSVARAPTLHIEAAHWGIDGLELSGVDVERVRVRRYRMAWQPSGGLGLETIEVALEGAADGGCAPEPGQVGGLWSLSDFGFAVVRRDLVDAYVRASAGVLGWDDEHATCNLF